MKIDSIKYFFRDAFKSIKRNKTLSIASVATVTATFFILGMVALTLVNVNKAVSDVGSKVEARVYLKEDITSEEKAKLEKTLKDTDGVLKVELESKEEALENLKNQLGDEEGTLTAGFDKNNPLPKSYIIRVKDPKSIDNVVEAIKDMKGIERIKDAREIIDKVTKITDAATMAGIGASIIFILVSIFLIGNTIKITVFSRKREIGIMKYVGATDWFIRWPFVIEGVILGILGALISLVLVYFGYYGAQNLLEEYSLGFKFIDSIYILKTLSWEFILGGMFIGSLGSIISMRKFLKV